MPFPYLCPNCNTNRSRFNLIEQVVQPVKKDARTGEILQQIDPADPLQYKYTGEQFRVQCGVCGIVESEERFIKNAERSQLV